MVHATVNEVIADGLTMEGERFEIVKLDLDGPDATTRESYAVNIRELDGRGVRTHGFASEADARSFVTRVSNGLGVPQGMLRERKSASEKAKS